LAVHLITFNYLIEMEKLYKLSEFARLVGVSRSGVVKWIKEGRIRAVNIRDRWYIPESELERLAKDSMPV